MINDIGSIANGISIVKSNKQKSPPQGTRSVSKGVYLMKGERTPSIPKSLLWDGDFSADLALSFFWHPPFNLAFLAYHFLM